MPWEPQTWSFYLSAPLTWFWLVMGAAVGSFLNVCIYRVPRKIFFKHARSVCPACGAPIAAWHNIPILSWLWLRGRARCCGAPIPVGYLLVEVATALIFPAIYWKFPFVLEYHGGLQVDPQEFIRFMHLAIFVCVLLVCSVIDLQFQIIPDVISLPMIALTPAVVMIHPELSWQSALLGVLLGGGVLFGIAWIYYLIRKEAGMGMGDVKLLAAIGGWLGYEALIPTVFIASVAGAVVGVTGIIATRRLTLKSALPFGPFLALGAVIYFVFGHQLQEYLFQTP